MAEIAAMHVRDIGGLPTFSAVGLFGRRRPAPPPSAVDVPVPSTPAERVEALKIVLLEQGVAGAAAQGVPLPVGDAFERLAATVEHLLPDAAERRALCRQLAEDLQSMVLVDAVDADEVREVLGVTPARPTEREVRGRADTALALAREARLGEGDLLDRWADDDRFALETLTVLLLVFTRLAV
jgi:hypothetical protein